ncbi:MAG: hypothetical protein Q8N34_03425 [Gammaproteobacteria bacterium]|nr:hypothetical protein [Gammaproteobacteria bacterium]
MDECKHKSFEVKVGVNRISETEDGPVTHFCADIRIRCQECGTHFEFLGLPAGMNPYGAAVSIDRTELLASIMPPGNPPPAGLMGFGIDTARGPDHSFVVEH